MKIRNIGIALSALAGLIIAGCGGGSNSNGGSGSGGISGGGDAATLTRHATSMKALADQFSTLPHQDTASDNQALLQFLKQRTEFAAVGQEEPGSVWARFKDDGELLVISNDGSSIPPAQAATGKSVLSSLKLTAHAAARDATEVPTGQKIFIYNNIGYQALPTTTTLQDLSESVELEARAVLNCRSLNELFTDAKYTPTYVEGGTPFNLKNIQNADGLYMFGHGGLGLDGSGRQVFILNTSLPVTSSLSVLTLGTSNLDNYKALYPDIRAGRVGMMMYATTEQQPTKASAGRAIVTAKQLQLKPYYYITSKFVQQYMSFSPNNSFVFINGCNGFDGSLPGVSDFLKAFQAKNAAVYISWSKHANGSEAADSAGLFFDGLTGMNKSFTITPPQRSFAYPDILQAMANMPRPGASYGFNQSLGDEGPSLLIVQELAAAQGTQSGQPMFGLLAPSIQNMRVDETKEQLTINGIFGNDPGQDQRKITVAGTELDAGKIQWSPTQLLCQLPHLAPGQPEPPGSAGDVIVTVRDHQSNTVQLTEWMGKFTYSQMAFAYPPDPLPPGLLPTEPIGNPMGSYNFDVTIHFRADVHTFRAKPGNTFVYPNTIPFTLAQDSTAVLTSVSGNFTNIYKITDTYQKNPASGFSFMPPLVSMTGATSGWTGSGSIDVQGKTVNLAANGILQNGIQDMGHYDPNAYPGHSDATGLKPALFFIRMQGSNTLSLMLDSSFNIAGGSATVANNPLLDVITLQWGAIPAKYPPDQNAAQ